MFIVRLYDGAYRGMGGGVGLAYVCKEGVMKKYACVQGEVGQNRGNFAYVLYERPLNTLT